jgi:hypothetical protein
MPHGGKRPGAGRRHCSKNKSTIALQQALAEAHAARVLAGRHAEREGSGPRQASRRQDRRALHPPPPAGRQGGRANGLGAAPGGPGHGSAARRAGRRRNATGNQDIRREIKMTFGGRRPGARRKKGSKRPRRTGWILKINQVGGRDSCPPPLGTFAGAGTCAACRRGRGDRAENQRIKSGPRRTGPASPESRDDCGGYAPAACGPGSIGGLGRAAPENQL